MSDVPANPVTAIAVVGMACRVPGGIDSPQALWKALLRGDDLVTEVPPDRWDADDLYDPEPGAAGLSVSRWGAFLDDVTGFDPEFFGIGEREATAMDPQHRLLLETCWEAVEHAGMVPSQLSGTATGVFMGLSHDDYAMVTSDAGAFGQAYAFTGTPFSMATGRVAHALGLRGPAISLDTACSSSLVAVHTACRSLSDGETDMALAGGVMVMLDQRLFASASGQGMLSPTGRCHPFDVAADGFVRGEACGVVLLKRLVDAQRDGDPVLAVICGTAANHDGRTSNVLAPSVDAQGEVFRSALAAAAVDPTTVGMVEAHGTGTPVGDTAEFLSLSGVYGTEGPCALTSVKGNVGHAESASGVLGLMKVVLAVQAGTVPANLHFHQLPGHLATIDTGLFVPVEATPWPVAGGPRRAAVSSYGMSGTNAHVIIEQAPDSIDRPVAVDSDRLLFALSSSSAEQLCHTARRLADWVDAQGDDLSLTDLAGTLAHRRGHRSVRTAVLARDRATLVARLREVASGDEPAMPVTGHDNLGPVWVFSGQGSQWASMGSGLLAAEPVFAAVIAELEPLIEAESGFSVTEALLAPEPVVGIDRVQPTLFALQVAMARTLASYGVTPGAVIGHSMGEVAAAVVAGGLSLEDGVRVICRRSLLCLRVAGKGAMAAVELPAAQVRQELDRRRIDDVVVAVVASPTSTVIGGATRVVRELVAHWKDRDIAASEVSVDVASHTPQVDPVLDALAEALAGIVPMKPHTPFYSATHYDPRETPLFDAAYWVDNLRHMVRFSAAVQTALEDGFRVFGELSPHPLLSRAVNQTAAGLDIPITSVAAMRRGQDLPHGLGSMIGHLYAAGAAIDLDRLVPAGGLVDAPLPTWTHRRLALEPVADTRRGKSAGGGHPLLTVHVRLPDQPERHLWEGNVGTDAHAWLADHRVNGVAALAGAAYIEMALEAAQTLLGDSAELRDVRFERLLLLEDSTPIRVIASAEGEGRYALSVETGRDGDASERDRRASAVLVAVGERGRPAPRDVAGQLASQRGGDEVRAWFATRGVQYGPAFRALLSVDVVADGCVLAEIALPSAIRGSRSDYAVHPALLDACFQSVAALPGVHNTGSGGLLLPLGARSLRVHAPTHSARYCRVSLVSLDAATLEVDLELLDHSGAVLMSMSGLTLGSGVWGEREDDRVLGDRLLGVEWEARPLPDLLATTGRWLLVPDDHGSDPLMTRSAEALSAEIGAALMTRGVSVTTLPWPVSAGDDDSAERLRQFVADDEFDGVVVIAGSVHPSEAPPSHDGRDQVSRLVRCVRELPVAAGSPRLFVVTCNSQVVVPGDVPALAYGGVSGLMRVIGAEFPRLRPTHIDLDGTSDGALVARQLLAESDEDQTAFRSGEWLVARLHHSPLRPDERPNTVADHEHDGIRMQVRVPGDPESLELVAHDRRPPGAGQVEVAVSASSVNFADVLVAFDRYPTIDGRQPHLGVDFAGVVAAVGPGVTTLRVGDRVVGMSPEGCWGTFVTCDARLAVALPPGVSDVEAAAVATAGATAWHSLHDLARIAAGDRVLVHSATGGVGQVAIALARAAGATVFATAGSDARRQKLRSWGVEHVYDSRGTAFAEEIRSDTGGEGVDVVLNSLPGAAQRAGMELLRDGGRFVELGKKDIYADSRLGLLPFRRNLSFFGVDLALMCSTHPARVSELLTTVLGLTDEGVLPLPSLACYPLVEAGAAVRSMSAAQHVGKVVLTVTRVGSSTVVIPPHEARVFRRDGSYLVSGGLGGLGLLLAERMAIAGSGRIVLSSRSEPDVKALEAIERMRAAGTEVEVVRGDISRSDTAVALVAAAVGSGLPLRGVLHAAAVVEDAVLTSITDELIGRDWGPKADGAWNLHQATLDQPLNWFCSLTSVAALLGSPGQGAYAAANSWVDAFTQWRRAQGLPATAIAWSAWGHVGAGAHLAARGDTVMIQPDEGAYAFDALLRHTRGNAGYAPVLGSPWLAALAERSPFASAFRGATNHRSASGTFVSDLRRRPSDEWPTYLRRMVSEQLSLILRRSVDPDRPVSEYGLDSLGTLELRTRIEAETGVRVRASDITTVRALADALCLALAEHEADASVEGAHG